MYALAAKKKFACLTLLAGLTFFGTTLTAHAVPTWIGVYGSFERHAGDNPGTFTVLMNQDYIGLHAQVGVQVNGGAWTAYEMAWAGNPDGNSQWTFTPDTPFPAGSTILYYFHGYDDWGNNLWDSNNGNNYSLAMAGGTGTLHWGGLRPLPASAQDDGASGWEIAAYGGVLYTVWQQQEGFPTLPNAFFSKKTEGSDWEAPYILASGQMVYPHLAASSSGVHFLYNDTADWSAKYSRSTDGGLTWSAPVSFTGLDFSVPARYAKLAADDDYVYVVYNLFTAPESSRIYFRRMHKDATAWEAPVLVFEHTSYKVTVNIDDVQVNGNNIALTTYAQSWYGGFSQPFFHESTDGGQTWTDVTPAGDSFEMDTDAADGVYLLASNAGDPWDTGAFLSTRPFGGTWSSAANVWPGAGSCDALRKTSAGLVAISLRNNLRYYRISEDQGATWGLPQLFDSSGTWCMQDVKDGDRIHLLLSGNGDYYTLSSTQQSGGPPLDWVGNTRHTPANGDLYADDDLIVRVESYPLGAGVAAHIVFTTDGQNWSNVEMLTDGDTGANDRWAVNLGSFAEGTVVQYATMVEDAYGSEVWDNNNGTDYTATVGGGSSVQPPAFWALDPYLGDNETVRANGRAPDANTHGLGEFEAGQPLTIVARPVENGNGNNVQEGPVTITSVLHYTTTGDWADVIAVTGTFHAAYFSSKPHFDYFSYDLGSFPDGAAVAFWLDAGNAEGLTYAQNAGEDFWFTVAGNSDVDTDADGLLDSWEDTYFHDLDDGAEDNPDGDGPLGRPLANIIEQTLGLSPTVPNDPMGIRLLWSPAYPSPGDELTLSYFYVNEGNPLFGKPVYAHVGHNGWQETYDTAQLGLNGQITRFEVTVTVPDGATEVNVVFHDNAGTWDNNGGRDWTIPVKPVAGGGGGTSFAPLVSTPSAGTTAPSPARAPAKKAATLVRVSEPEPAGATTTSTAAATPESATTQTANRLTTLIAKAQRERTLRISLTGHAAKDPGYLIVGRQGWQNLQVVPLRRTRGARFQGTMPLAEGTKIVNIAVVNRDGTIDLNGQAGWKFLLAGNGSNSVLITR